MIKRATTPFCFLLEILFPAQNVALFVKRCLKVKHTEEYRNKFAQVTRYSYLLTWMFE